MVAISGDTSFLTYSTTTTTDGGSTTVAENTQDTPVPVGQKEEEKKEEVKQAKAKVLQNIEQVSIHTAETNGVKTASNPITLPFGSGATSTNDVNGAWLFSGLDNVSDDVKSAVKADSSVTSKQESLMSKLKGFFGGNKTEKVGDTETPTTNEKITTTADAGTVEDLSKNPEYIKLSQELGISPNEELSDDDIITPDKLASQLGVSVPTDMTKRDETKVASNADIEQSTNTLKDLKAQQDEQNAILADKNSTPEAREAALKKLSEIKASSIDTVNKTGESTYTVAKEYLEAKVKAGTGSIDPEDKNYNKLPDDVKDGLNRVYKSVTTGEASES